MLCKPVASFGYRIQHQLHFKACPNIRKEVGRIMFSNVLEHRYRFPNFCNICCIKKSRFETVILNFNVVQAKFTENKQSKCTRLLSVTFRSIFYLAFIMNVAIFTFRFFDVARFRCCSVQKSLLIPLRKVHFPELLQSLSSVTRESCQHWMPVLNSGGAGRDRVFVFRCNSKSIVASGWNPLHISRLLTTG